MFCLIMVNNTEKFKSFMTGNKNQKLFTTTK